jgi:hypothetical protein
LKTKDFTFSRVQKQTENELVFEHKEQQIDAIKEQKSREAKSWIGKRRVVGPKFKHVFKTCV